MNFNAVYFEPDSLNYSLGQKLKADYGHLPWIPIESHNRIEEMQKKPNAEFHNMKSNLIIGTRKTHKYVENAKISDYLVPFTSSGCTAACLYCYLVCNYNKCSYLRLFVNREQMLERLIKNSYKYDYPCTFEIGSNSDLILENTITQNLEWIIPYFAKEGRGNITFPTKFSMVDSLLPLNHGGKTIFRMSVNPSSIIDDIEIGTASLTKRIQALNRMCEAGYPTGILIAPVILTDQYKQLYEELLITLAETLTQKTKNQLFIEVIFMTYSFIHRAINQDAFPNRPDLYHKELMTGRGRGRYCYRPEARQEGEIFIKDQIKKHLPEAELVYIS